MKYEDIKKCKEHSNGWDYVLLGLLLVDKTKLERTIPLGLLLNNIIEYWIGSAFVGEDTIAKSRLSEHPIFAGYQGRELTCREYFDLLSQFLIHEAGYSSNELEQVERIEKDIDNLNVSMGYEPRGVTEMIYPANTHTTKPSSDASYDEKVKVPIMIGDALNILGYFYNDIANRRKPTVKKLYTSLYIWVTKEGNFTNTETIDMMRQVDDCYEKIKKMSKSSRN